MSTFGGKIEEIENISVDRFDEDNIHSWAYFLSHCHTDHMKGLDCHLFQAKLKERDGVFLYVSPVSAEILKLLHTDTGLAKKIKPLPLEEPVLIPVKEKTVCVTLLRAGHCPGSVMFLFEYDGKVILYTGDYRIHKNDFKKFNAFKNAKNGTMKHFNKIYLDTTFFSKTYPSFPARDACVKKVCEKIRSWLEQDEHRGVHLITSANYGYEYLLIEISKELGMPVHVREKQHDFYRCIPEMDKAVTLKPHSTLLHNNCGENYQTVCPVGRSKFLLRIRFSAMPWTETLLENNELGIIDENFIATKVCYSTHASLEEGQALIKTLKPEAIEPCVVPRDEEQYSEMMQLIDETMMEYKGKICVKKQCESETKLFVVKDDEMHTETNQSVCSETLTRLMESPPTTRKKKMKQ